MERVNGSWNSRSLRSGMASPGFTMVEVMSVVAIVAILLAVAAVGIRPSGESARRAAKGEMSPSARWPER